MKQYIATRRIDQLGRIVLPIEARKLLSLDETISVEIWVDQASRHIIIQPAITDTQPSKTA